MDWLRLRAKGGTGRGNLQTSTPSTASEQSIMLAPELANKFDFPIAPFMEETMCNSLLPSAADLHRLIEPNHLLDENEWLAMHLVGLLGNVSALWDAVSDTCNCPSMTGPPAYLLVCSESAPSSSSKKNGSVQNTSGGSLLQSLHTATWINYLNSNNGCAAGNHSSPQARLYIDTGLTHCHLLLSQSSVFPTRHGEPFPTHFRQQCGLITRRLFHCLVHFYWAHFELFQSLDLVPYLNTVCKHWMLFNARFGFVEEKELELLSGLHVVLLTTQLVDSELDSASTAFTASSDTTTYSGGKSPEPVNDNLLPL